MTTWLGSTNYTYVNKRRILGLVIHSSECSLDVMTHAFNTPGGASAHYAIGMDGKRYQYVEEDSAAYHVAAFGSTPALNRNRPNWLPAYNGLYSAVNACTIGVELEGYAATGFTPAQYAELGRLIAEKSSDHEFPPTLLVDDGADARIVTHAFLQTDRSDPGARFDWERLRAALIDATKEDEPMTEEQQQILDAAGRQGLDAAGIDQMAGVNRDLGAQVNSLSWLLRTSQDETQVQAAEVARLQALAVPTPVIGASPITSIAVMFGDGRIETITR